MREWNYEKLGRDTIKNNKIERILRELIKRWRNPFWKWYTIVYVFDSGIYFFWSVTESSLLVDYRQLTSMESWLWEFVCKNKLYNRQAYVWYTNIEWFWDEFCDKDYQFWLMESSIRSNKELKDFLLSNINI